MPEGIKRCPVCRQVKSTAEFASDRSKTDGLMVRCKRCDSDRNIRYYYETARARKLKPPKPCRSCGGATPSARHWYCERCLRARKRHKWREAEKRRNRGTPAERGYGTAHQKLRAEWAKVVSSGAATCARCHEPIAFDEPWDLGHDDLDRSRYTGPEHQACNRRTSAHRKEQGVSRSW